MAWAGGANDENKVEAGALNQTQVGLAFGVNLDAGQVVYGRLAGFSIRPSAVTLWLDGVAGDAGVLDVGPSTELWFSAYTQDSQALELLVRIEKHLDSEPRR